VSRANALSQASQWAAVAVLALVALLLRGRGMDHGLPHWIEPDAELAEQVEHLRGDGQGARGAASVATYPILPALVTMALFAMVGLHSRGSAWMYAVASAAVGPALGEHTGRIQLFAARRAEAIDQGHQRNSERFVPGSPARQRTRGLAWIARQSCRYWSRVSRTWCHRIADTYGADDCLPAAPTL
jgi:hypothetical protein